MHIIVGLGNPGEEYKNTRHNAGRVALLPFLKEYCDEEMESSKKHKALVAQGKVKKEKVTVLFPETFMNKSGGSVAPLITSAKKAEKLIVVYDELDLPLGSIKISFNRGSGGHRGIESVIRGVKTKAFVRIRVGTSPTTPSGKLRKPQGEKEVEKFILGEFSDKELATLKKVAKTVSEAVATIVTDGREIAMGEFN